MPPRSSRLRWRRLLLPLLVSLTLGLAPFAPEPHVVGKVRWVLGGAEGMQPLDWLDLVLHGAPWLWLVGAAAWELWRGLDRARRRPEGSGGPGRPRGD